MPSDSNYRIKGGKVQWRKFRSIKEIKKPKTQYRVCPMCKGDGRPCPTCKGKGKVEDVRQIHIKGKK